MSMVLGFSACTSKKDPVVEDDTTGNGATTTTETEYTDYCYKEVSETSYYELIIVSKDDFVFSIKDIYTGDYGEFDPEEYVDFFEEEIISVFLGYDGIYFTYQIEDDFFVREYFVKVEEASQEGLIAVGLLKRELSEGEYLSRRVTLEINESNGYVCETQ